MIRAIIFDCFGVLVQGTHETFAETHFPGNYDKRLKMRELDDAASRGYSSYKEFVHDLAELAGISEEQTARELEDNPSNVKLFEYIEQILKPTYAIGFLSNAAEDWTGTLFTTEQRGLFDATVLSCQVKIAKPDERIFELTASNLGVSPAECVMVDDVERYCTGAEDAGMKAICYKDFAQFEKELTKLLQ